MTATTIVLARHASPENPGGIFYGHLDGFGLSALGRRQAGGLGDWLAALPAPLQRVYASPLQRAQETAAVAVSRLPRPVPIETREDLLETAFGRYVQGVRQRDVVWRRPLFWVHLVRPGLLAIDETVEAMAARVDRVCAEALETCSGHTALLVSHADPIKAWWNRYRGRADWRFHGLGVGKGAWLELSYADGRLGSVRLHGPLTAPAGDNSGIMKNVDTEGGTGG